ncbi:MAG: DUF4118 domain-containing protein [Burkholderiales bacterium]|nr:DUF4118 domain-containing protein [Burkholderiales bacterium]
MHRLKPADLRAGGGASHVDMPGHLGRVFPLAERRWYGLLVWVLAWAVMWWLDGRFEVPNLALMLVLASATAGLWLSPIAAFLTNSVSILFFSYFFVNPRLSFTPALRDDLVLLVSVYGVSSVISYLTVRLRRAVTNEALQALRADQLRQLGEQLREATDLPAKVEALRALLSKYAGVPCFVRLGNDAMSSHQNTEHEFFGEPTPFQKQRLVIEWQRITSAVTVDKANDAQRSLPIRGRENLWGIVLFHEDYEVADDGPGYEHFCDLCQLLGVELERYMALAQAREAAEQVRTQAIRNTLLTAVSHDYHTPLSTIMGAASVLVEQANSESKQDIAVLAATIIEETEQLHRMTNNTLQLARLDVAGIVLNKNWESLEEIIGTVIARIKRRAPNHQFNIHLALDLPLLNVDVVLIMQLLDNLLQNSIKYSRLGSVITIDAKRSGEEMFLSVCDRGEGIPGWWREQVFEIFQRVDGNQQPSDGRTGKQTRRGAGVGLAVCRAIVRVHGGRIWIEDNPGGGTCVNMALPIGAPPSLPMSLSEELI